MQQIADHSASQDDPCKDFEDFESLEREAQQAQLHNFTDPAISSTKRELENMEVLPKNVSKTKKTHKRKMRREEEKLAICYLRTDEIVLLKHFKKLLSYLQTPQLSLSSPAFTITAALKIKCCAVVYIPGLVPSDFGISNTEPFKTLHKLDGAFDTPMEFVKSHSEFIINTYMCKKGQDMFPPMATLYQFPLTKKEKQERTKLLGTKQLVITDILLTKSELVKNGFPMHSSLDASEANALPEGWVETTNFEHEGSKIFALDCEFCMAGDNQVLTRVSVVNFNDEIVYDTYVKPEELITDYLTRFSGITEEILCNVTKTREDVQQDIVKIISSSDIMVGHSLNSDLNVMRIRHPQIVDTLVIYKHHRGGKYKHALRWLTNTHLKRKIQDGERDGTGHSSVEDLIACMDLVKLKLEKGPDFGRNIGISLFKKLSDRCDLTHSLIVNFPEDEVETVLNDIDARVNVCSAVDDDDVVSIATSKAKDTILMALTFNELENQINHNHTSNGSPAKFSNLGETQRKEVLARVDGRLKQLHASMPPNSFILVLSGSGALDEVSRLQGIKKGFEKYTRLGVDLKDIPVQEIWDFDRVNELEEAQDNAKRGVLFVIMK